MAKDANQLDNYNKPFADEANAEWKHLVEYCLEKYEKSKSSQYRSKKLDEIRKAVEVYNQTEKVSSEPFEGATAYTMPLTTISLDNLEPRLVSGLVGKFPFIRFEMENDQKKDEPTEILQEWFNQELEDVVGIEGVVRSVVHRILQDGTVYAIPSYDIDEEVRSDFVFQDEAQKLLSEDPEFAAEIAQKVEFGEYVWEAGLLMDVNSAEPVFRDTYDSIFEGGRVKLIPFHDVYIQDDVDDWDAAPVIRKVYPTYSELIKHSVEKDGYRNIGPWLYDEAKDGKYGKDDLSATQEYDDVKEHGKKVIECIECSISYAKVEDDAEEKNQTDFREEKIIAQIALDSKILIRAISLRKIYHKNKHLLRRLRLFPEEGKSYGTGMATKLKSIQKGASKTFNMAINIVEVTMIPWFLFDETSGLSNRYKDGIKLKIGQGYPVDNVQGLYFPRFSINPDQMFNWINLWVSFWERLSSIGDLQVGRSGEKDRTATETMAVIQEGNIKHNYQSMSIREDFLELLKIIYDLYYQHMPFNKTFLWAGKNVSIPRALMRRKKSFRLTGSTELSNKLIERKEKETFYQMSSQDPNINPVKRAEELVKAYGYNDTTEWVSQNIRGLVDAITKIPGAQQVVGKVLQDLEMQAQEQANVQQRKAQEQ